MQPVITLPIEFRLSLLRRFGLGLLMSWLFIYTTGLLIADLSVVFFTKSGYWQGLEFAESYMTPVCHRMPSRSFWMLDVPLGLCARCTGIYLGVSLGALLMLTRSRPLRIPFLPVALLIFIAFADGTAQHYALYTSSNTARAMVGLGYGIGITSLVMIMFHRENTLFSIPSFYKEA